MENATVPVIQTGVGTATYDGSADQDMARRIVVNAKCNGLECVTPVRLVGGRKHCRCFVPEVASDPPPAALKCGAVLESRVCSHGFPAWKTGGQSTRLHYCGQSGRDR